MELIEILSYKKKIKNLKLPVKNKGHIRHLTETQPNHSFLSPKTLLKK